ncbi:MAG: RNA-directed DNA polymerase [Rhodocyclaceae bacterium]|nr:RNA-directed DNA polymerase [Rhodocyclaceae bacterium]
MEGRTAFGAKAAEGGRVEDSYDDEEAAAAWLAARARATQAVATALARAFLAACASQAQTAADAGGPVAAPHTATGARAAAAAMQACGRRVLRRKYPWLARLVRHVQAAAGDCPRPAQHDEVRALILEFPPFRSAFEDDEPPRVHAWFPWHECMRAPPRRLAGLNLPQLDTPGDLAAWLHVSVGELAWFADPGGWAEASGVEALRHYRYRWNAKAGGGWRLLEIPKPRLAALQRKILREILDRVPPHAAAQGAVRGRSALGNAAMHADCGLVLRLDIEDFFPRLAGARIAALFRTLGYAPAVARLLAGLCSHATPAAVSSTAPCAGLPGIDGLRARRDLADMYGSPHLPQGAPTSPALANLAAYRLDLRLDGAARACGWRYTRYVDDLFFSGPGGSPAHALRTAQMLQGIVLDEGYRPNFRKTRVMPRGRRQLVTGLVVNRRAAIPRDQFDRFKAMLTNCLRHGAASQNRDGVADFRASVAGRLAWFEQVNVARAAKLRALFDAINWA